MTRENPTTPELLTQKAAAALLSVSVSWLRASDAPRLLLPGHGPSGCPVLRYPRGALLEWAGIGRDSSQQDAPQCASAREIPQEKSAQKSADHSPPSPSTLANPNVQAVFRPRPVPAPPSAAP